MKIVDEDQDSISYAVEGNRLAFRKGYELSAYQGDPENDDSIPDDAQPAMYIRADYEIVARSEKEFSADEIAALANQESVQLLYPMFRQKVLELTSGAGFPPLLLEALRISSDYEVNDQTG